MKRIDDEKVRMIMEDALGSHTLTCRFDTVWEQYRRKQRQRIPGMKKRLAIPLFAVFTLSILLAMGYQYKQKMDRTDYPFIPDPQVMGKWETVDFLGSIADFTPEQQSWKEELYLKTLVFLGGGRVLSALENGKLGYSSFNWTKGKVIDKREKTTRRYTVRNINGLTYLFLEWKNGDYRFKYQKPNYYVLRRAGDQGYDQIRIKRHEDRVDFPFTNDAQVIGKWQTVDFVKTLTEFTPGKQSWIGYLDELLIKDLIFLEEGKILNTGENGTLSYSVFSWTKGKVMNKSKKMASIYITKDFNGMSYLFLEWKTDDYSVSGLRPGYYVLKKVDNKDYRDAQVLRKADKVDYAFKDDPRMRGKWESVAYVATLDEFQPGYKSFSEELQLTGLIVEAGGKLTLRAPDTTVSEPFLRWTKGLIINEKLKTASRCKFKAVGRVRYLFYEWKNGDYILQGGKPGYYVLRKLE